MHQLSQYNQVVGLEGDTITIQDIFTFDYKAGFEADGRFAGTVRPTGIRPRFSEHLQDVGVELPAGVFGEPNLDALAGKRRS